jgi:hypothetical protein
LVLQSDITEEGFQMPDQFKRGDRVEWSFRGHRVVGTVRRRLTKRTEIGGRVVAASKDEPRFVVRSEKSGKETVRRAESLKPLQRVTPT